MGTEGGQVLIEPFPGWQFQGNFKAAVGESGIGVEFIPDPISQIGGKPQGHGKRGCIDGRIIGENPGGCHPAKDFWKGREVLNSAQLKKSRFISEGAMGVEVPALSFKAEL